MTNNPLPLRDAHREYTRSRILDAAIQLLKQCEFDDFQVGEVAAQAGIAERTVYRYFATRAELIDAVWAHVGGEISSPCLDTPQALAADPLTAFPEFDAREPLIRAIIDTRQGKALRLAVYAQRAEMIRRAVRIAHPDLAEPDFTGLCAVVDLLHSSVGWSVMKDYWKIDGTVAGRAASKALAELLHIEAPR